MNLSSVNRAISYLSHAGRIIILTAVGLLFVRFFIVSPGQVNGPSMRPTLHDNDVFFISKLAYLVGKPDRYDIVQIARDNPQAPYVIKRIIGLPGETIVITGGEVFLRSSLGDVQIEEWYVSDFDKTYVPSGDKVYSITLDSDEVFVMGDNRDESVDSRHYGAVRFSDLIGPAIGKR